MTPDAGALEFDIESLAAVARLRSRFRGALLGLAIGEALAAPAQFARPGGFAPIRDLIGGGPFDLTPGSWTDDTAMALLLGRSLLECGGCDPADQLDRFRRWQLEGEESLSGECLGITASVSKALADGKPSNEVTDGADALVRMSPLVLWHYADKNALMTDLESMVRVTCRESSTLVASREFALMAHSALRGKPLRTYSPKRKSAESARQRGASASALAIVKESMYGARSWKEAVLRAVNQGGDADVHGAATGQLAGAVFGVESIPAGWLAMLAGRTMIEELADSLLVDVLVRLDVAD
ncbi:MAG: ADP-ribosylglycohydrolase family protein [Gammaproteobacteria bacterium]|nr:ADP-ribosylglycohydrolase family protein [Gammaproteobacteria bacterium]